MSEASEKLVNNSVLTLVARGMMIFATVVGLPIAGWMINRAVASVDSIAGKVDSMKDQASDTNGTVKLIQQTQTIQTSIIADHETRMRLLERVPRP